MDADALRNLFFWLFGKRSVGLDGTVSYEWRGRTYVVSGTPYVSNRSTDGDKSE